jgi:hypothetical protein
MFVEGDKMCRTQMSLDEVEGAIEALAAVWTVPLQGRSM